MEAAPGKGTKKRHIFISGNTICEYVYKTKQGAFETLKITYECKNHKGETLYKDVDGFYLLWQLLYLIY